MKSDWYCYNYKKKIISLGRAWPDMVINIQQVHQISNKTLYSSGLSGYLIHQRLENKTFCFNNNMTSSKMEFLDFLLYLTQFLLTLFTSSWWQSGTHPRPVFPLFEAWFSHQMSRGMGLINQIQLSFYAFAHNTSFILPKIEIVHYTYVSLNTLKPYHLILYSGYYLTLIERSLIIKCKLIYC